MELPLAVQELKRGWTHFEFVTIAKEWDATKQLAVILTLLRGKLIDYYAELDKATKKDFILLRAALEERAGKRRIHWLHQKTLAIATKAKARGYLTLHPPLNSCLRLISHKKQWLQQCSYRDS